MGRKKLCLVIPSLQAGGMERVMSELASYFSSKKDMEIHLILYGNTRELFYRVPASIIIHEPSFRFNNKWRFFFTIKTLFYLRKTIKKINPNSILSFGEYWNSFVLLSLYGLYYPIYISDRCQPDKYLGKLHTILRKCLYPCAKGIIAQTSRAKEIYKNQFKHNNIRIIGNPLRIINDLSDVPVRENIVLTVGRLIKSKNHNKLIELFVRINMSGWKLIIVGDDALKQNHKIHLQKTIKKLNAENKVILAGNQSNVEQFYLRSKIFAFTSDSEGFPNVIGEALSYGLPVIAFDCISGPSDLIRDNINGFLIPLFDYGLFQKKLEFLMNNTKIREQLGLNARESVKKFSIEYIGEQFFNFVSCQR